MNTWPAAGQVHLDCCSPKFSGNPTVVSSPLRMTADSLRRDLLPLLLDAARELRPLL